MALAEQIVVRIPHLRRFGRALTGSQASGDAYVAAVLEAVAADTAALPEKSDVTISLYSLFCRLWQTLDVNGKSDASAPAWEVNADRRLASLVPRERLVFLLRVLEGFSTAQTAEILDTDAADIERELDLANADIAAQLKSRVLIIEDEPLIALDIERLVKSLGHEVMHIARTHREAIAAIQKSRPELVLADVQLADGSSGINAVKEILEECSPPVVFITAFPERLLTGERPEPTFLISKPYDPDAVKAMISQVLFFRSGEGDRKVA
ncbi:MAG: response regulator [Bauldia sp.]